MKDGEIAVVVGDVGNHVSASGVGGGGRGGGGGGDERMKWAALLQSKCEVLGMEKELAMQKWRQHCVEMAKAAEMAQPLRPGSVETILEATMRGTASAPCTPRRKKEEDGVDLVQNIQQLQISRERQENLGKIKGDRTPLQATRVNDRQQKQTIDKIVTQVKADAEEWAQIQGVLKHIKDEMKTLQQNCDNWEQRALRAESKSAILQIEEERWRVQAQLSQQKIEELELEMAQVCTGRNGLKRQFAGKQSEVVQASGNGAYVLVLKPVLRQSTSDICTCNISTHSEECQECANGCCMPLTHNLLTGKFLCNVCALNAFKFDNTEQGMARDSVQRVADSQRRTTPRAQIPLQKSTMEVSKADDRRGAQCSPRSQSNLSPRKAEDERLSSSASETTLSEVERSLKQKWFKQRKPSRRSNGAYSYTSFQENNANICAQPNPTWGRTDGRRHSMKESRPAPSASNLKVSPPHLFQERLPLSEMRRNTIHER